MSAISKMITPDGAAYDIRDANALRAEAAAPSFSDSASYAVGDVVTKDGLVYRCSTARAAGAWNSGSGFEVFPLWKKANPYPFVTVAVSSGVATLQPFANNQMDLSAEHGATAFAVAFAASPVSGTMRDLWFVVKTGLRSPTVTWPSDVVAADENSDNLVVDADAVLAFHIVECAAGVFLVFKQVLESGSVQFPYDAEVEYLGATGTQWIDTGFNANATFGFEIDCNFLADNGVFGTVNGAPSGQLGVDRARYQFGRRYLVSGNNTLFYGFNDTNYGTWLSIPLDCSNRHVYRFVNGVFSVDGTEYTIGSHSYFTARPFYLFASYETNGPALFCTSLMFSAKFYNGADLVADLIPVRVGSGENAVGYLYDCANPTGGPYGNGLYDNSGTGAFVVGPDKT